MAKANSNLDFFSKNSNLLYIILGVLLIAIILFAIFYPRKQYDESVNRGMMMQANPMMEGFDDELMENMSDDKGRNSSKKTLVIFKANWCGHCQRAMPEFRKVEEEGQKSGKYDVMIVDADSEPELIKNEGVQGFPTIRLYPNGLDGKKYMEYNGDRSAEDISQFAESN